MDTYARPHVAIHIRSYVNYKNINHFKNLVQSLDLITIELVW